MSKLYFKGKSLKEMSKEELIEALELMNEVYNRKVENSKNERSFLFSLIKR